MNRHPIPIRTHTTANRRLLQAFLDDCARRIKRLPHSEQAGWVVYLLEQLQVLYETAPASRFNFLLDDIRADIAERIRTGSW